MAALKQITFSCWPTWNFQFAEKDLMRVHSVKGWPEGGGEQIALVEDEQYRLAIGRNGVSSLVLLRKGRLPKLAERPDAVTVEYEP